MKKTARPSTLRVAGLSVAALLGGYGIAANGPAFLLSDTQAMLGTASVGTSASIPENPYNTLAQQLKAKDDALTQREMELESRTAELQSARSLNDRFGMLSFALSIVLLALVGANYYFDYRRDRRGGASSFSVDLRNG